MASQGYLRGPNAAFRRVLLDRFFLMSGCPTGMQNSLQWPTTNRNGCSLSSVSVVVKNLDRLDQWRRSTYSCENGTHELPGMTHQCVTAGTVLSVFGQKTRM